MLNEESKNAETEISGKNPLLKDFDPSAPEVKRHRKWKPGLAR